MKYVMLIYSSEVESAKMSKEESEQQYADYMDFSKDVAQRGIEHGSEQLHPIASATTVRVRDGKKMITDGPFAETKEQLGGFYILDCKDMDEAIIEAAKIPTAKNGSIEIRPLVDFSS